MGKQHDPDRRLVIAVHGEGFMERPDGISVLVGLTRVALFGAAPDLLAQPWGGGAYHRGMNRMAWGGQLPSVTVSGNIIHDPSLRSGLDH